MRWSQKLSTPPSRKGIGIGVAAAMLLSSASGQVSQRSVGLLVIKRVLEDGWSVEKGFAVGDAQVLADGSAGAKGIREFVLGYLKAHPK